MTEQELYIKAPNRPLVRLRVIRRQFEDDLISVEGVRLEVHVSGLGTIVSKSVPSVRAGLAEGLRMVASRID